MLRSIWARDCDPARRLMGAALMLLLMFRLLAGPVAVAAPAPGVVPVCAGAKIVYLRLAAGPDDAPGKAGPRHADPCPFFGFAAAAPSAGLAPAVPQAAGFAAFACPATDVAAREAYCAGYASRAPPAAG